MHRREWLWNTGGGLGGVALACMLNEDAASAKTTAKTPEAQRGGLHHPAKARRVIQLFMNGGVSQMDTFDHKPELTKRHGQKFDPGSHVEAATSVPGNVMKSPFEFRRRGESGQWVSSVLPQLAECVDDIAILLAVASKTNVHGPASYMMNTGFLTPGFPCMGAWLSYGLGALSDELPTFVVLPDPRGLPYNAKGNFTSGFLPMSHQGTILNVHAADPIPDLFPSRKTKAPIGGDDSEREGLALLNRMNQRYADAHPGDSRLQARIASYELAARMQMSAPDALNLSGESTATRALYGVDDPSTQDFGRRCLIGRRLLERGVRFVQIWSGAGGPANNWDNHGDIPKELPAIAHSVDQPIAALLKDLKSRGMLDDTLVVFSTEFGRMPFTQGATGRDHNGGTGVAWLAGAGVKGGVSFGESDDWAWKAVKDRVYCYDIHATILHLLGIDHAKLTFRHNGIDRRLTDVHGETIRAILA